MRATIPIHEGLNSPLLRTIVSALGIVFSAVLILTAYTNKPAIEFRIEGEDLHPDLFLKASIRNTDTGTTGVSLVGRQVAIAGRSRPSFPIDVPIPAGELARFADITNPSSLTIESDEDIQVFVNATGTTETTICCGVEGFDVDAPLSARHLIQLFHAASCNEERDCPRLG